MILKGTNGLSTVEPIGERAVPLNVRADVQSAVLRQFDSNHGKGELRFRVESDEVFTNEYEGDEQRMRIDIRSPRIFVMVRAEERRFGFFNYSFVIDYVAFASLKFDGEIVRSISIVALTAIANF